MAKLCSLLQLFIFQRFRSLQWTLPTPQFPHYYGSCNSPASNPHLHWHTRNVSSQGIHFSLFFSYTLQIFYSVLTFFCVPLLCPGMESISFWGLWLPQLHQICIHVKFLLTFFCPSFSVKLYVLSLNPMILQVGN